ncbi:MAG: hypothetical protein R3F35_20255 [Myxococcota bacterium]
MTRIAGSRNGSGRRLLWALLIAAIPVFGAQAQTTIVGPTPYLSPADVPAYFYADGNATAIEDFEDCELSTADHGIGEETFGVCSNGPNRDSVLSDSGVIEGTRGNSWFSTQKKKYTFAEPVTAAGLVYTDGPGSFVFRVYGPGDSVLLETEETYDLDTAPDGSSADDRFFGARNPNGITAIEIDGGSSGLETDHVQYGNMGGLTATWDDGQAIQSSGGAITAALWVGLQISGSLAPTVETPDAETVVLSYAGLDPNSPLQLNVASFGLPFYPPDPVLVSGNQIQARFSNGGSMRTLVIDVSASSGDVIDPASVEFGNTSVPPEVTAYAFDPPPPGEVESLGIQMALTGGAGSPGDTTITLTLRVVDEQMIAIPVETVAPAAGSPVPGLGMTGLTTLAVGLGLLGLRKRRDVRTPEA